MSNALIINILQTKTCRYCNENVTTDVRFCRQDPMR